MKDWTCGNAINGRPKDVVANDGKQMRCISVEILDRGGTKGG